jgi:hypothetical protein
MLSLLAKAIVKLFTRIYLYILWSIYYKKNNGQPVRQQDMSAAMSDVSQSRISRGALGGANIAFKAKTYKRVCNRATSPLYEPRIHPRFKI